MDCLVKKLKGTVENPNMEYLNGISVVCSPTTEGEEFFFPIKGFVGDKIEILDPSNGNISKVTVGSDGNAYISISTEITRVFFPVNRIKEFPWKHAFYDIGIFYEYKDYTLGTSVSLIKSEIGKLFGDLTRAFGRHTNITQINTANQTEISGELHDLAKRQVANGRTSGNLFIYASGCPLVTVNGVAIGYTGKKIMFDSSVEGGYSIVNA